MTTPEPSDYYVVVPTALLKLGYFAFAVYGVLRDYADTRSDECWPSHRAISERAGMSVTKVKETLLLLRDEGWVAWEQRASAGGTQTSNIYRVYGSPKENTGSRDTASGSRDTASGSRDTTGGVAATRLPGSRHTATELIPNELVPIRTNTSSSADAADAEFDAFWAAYPRKVGKQSARKAFAKAAKTVNPSLIAAAARRVADDPNLPETKFIPHPSTWLNRGGWDDQPYPASSGQTKPPSGAAMFAALSVAESLEIAQ